MKAPTQAIVVAGLSGLLLAAVPTWAAAGQTAPDGAGEDSPPPSIMLVLDASGSMAEDDPSGGTKMEAARTALGAAVEGLPADASVGLRVYGSEEDSETRNDTVCTDSTIVQPLGPVDADGLKGAIAQVEPYGWTPIAYALGEAAKDLGEGENRHIILVSDGEETCSPDPCEEIRGLIDEGIKIQIDTVGFGVDEAARNQLQCIADTTGGSYLEAPDGDGLAVALDKLSTRATRGFTVSGAPIEGVLRNDIASAPEITAGQYTDKVGVGGEEIRYYSLRRQVPGSRLDLSVTTRPARNGDMFNTEGFGIAVETLDGDSCGSNRDFRLDASGSNSFVIVGARVDEDCSQEEELLLKVERYEGLGEAQPVEIRIDETPPATNVQALPEALGIAPEPPAQADLPDPTSPAEPVVGGTGFSDAPQLAPGTYVEQLIPGEVVFYRAAVDWGQSASFVIDGPQDDSLLSDNYSEPIRIIPGLFNPARSSFTNPHSNIGVDWNLDTTPTRFSREVPPVRYRNVEGPVEVRPASNAGDYYFSMTIPERYQGVAQGRPIPVQFTVDVTGEVTGVPEFPTARATDERTEATTEATGGAGTTDGAAKTDAAGTADGDAAASTEDAGSVTVSDEDSNTWLWAIAGGAALILLLAGGGLWAALRTAGSAPRSGPQH